MNPALRKLLTIFLIFVAWQVMDFIIHGVLLSATYGATADMWRPMEDMNHGLMMLVALASAWAFVMIYGLINPKSLKAGALFGLFFGIATGIGMGFGTYSVMDIPLNMAWTWFAGTIAETVVAGLIAGAMIKE